MPLSTEYVTKTEDFTWFMFRHNSFYNTHPSRWTTLQESLSAEFWSHIRLCLQQKDKRSLKHLSVFVYRSCTLQVTSNTYSGHSIKDMTSLRFPKMAPNSCIEPVIDTTGTSLRYYTIWCVLSVENQIFEHLYHNMNTKLLKVMSLQTVLYWKHLRATWFCHTISTAYSHAETCNACGCRNACVDDIIFIVTRLTAGSS